MNETLFSHMQELGRQTRIEELGSSFLGSPPPQCDNITPLLFYIRIGKASFKYEVP